MFLVELKREFDFVQDPRKNRQARMQHVIVRDDSRPLADIASLGRDCRRYTNTGLYRSRERVQEIECF